MRGPPLALWVGLLLAVAVQACRAGKVGKKGGDAVVGLAAALAATPELEPVCEVSNAQDSTEVDLVCPKGTTKDDNNPYCYTSCSVFNNNGIKFVTSTQNDDHCIPICPPGTTKLLASTGSVTCITCPDGFTGVPGKGCWTTCAGSFPEQWNTGPKPVCAQTCPGAAPLAADANTCKDQGGTKWLKRSTKSRAFSAPTKSQRILVKAKQEVDMVCPAGASMFVSFDQNNPEQAEPGCYTCPDGYDVTQDENQWVFCLPSGCPDGFNRCGDYCWSDVLPLDALSEDDCAAFLGVFSCLPSCFDNANKRRLK